MPYTARGQITITNVDSAQHISVTGTAHDVSEAVSTQLGRSVKVNGAEVLTNTSGRGLVVATIDRTTLQMVSRKWYDTYGDVKNGTPYTGSEGCTALVNFLGGLDDSVFVAIASCDAVCWTDNVITALKAFGLTSLPYYDNNAPRTPFAFLGYKGLSEGYALMQQHAPAAYTHTAKVGAYIVDGTFMSTRDGKDGRSLTATTEHYFASQYGAGDSHAPVTPTDGSDWGTDPNAQGWNENAKYLWNYERKTYANSDGSVTIARTAAHVVAIWTQDGKGIANIVNYYQRNNSTTTPSVTAYGQSGSPGSAWKTTVQPANGSNRYQWNFERVVYTDGTATDTTPHIIERYVVDGESPFFGDLDNEMDSVACNSDGKPTPSGQQIETTAVIHHGAEVYSQGFDTLSVYSDASCASEYSYNTFVNGVKVVRDTTTGKVSITFSNGAVLTKKTFYIKFQYGDSPEFVRSLTVNGVRPGANGDPAAVYQLVPSAKQVAHRKDGSYDNGTLTCAYTKNVGGTFVTPTGATLKVSLDGATEADYSTGGYDAGDDFDTQVEFLLYVDGEIVDRETIPVVEDGTDGDNAETFSIETSESEVHYDGDGELTTGFIDVRGYRRVGSGERSMVAGSALAVASGAHYYCSYSIDGGESWTKCAKKNNTYRYLGVPASEVAQVTSASRLRIRMQYATTSTETPSGDVVVCERDPLPVHRDGEGGTAGRDAADVQPNLLRQTLFETGKDDLWIKQFGTKTLVAGTDGRGAMQVSPTGATTTWGNTFQNVADVLEVGTEYTISFYAKSSAPFYLYIDGLDSSGGNAVWFDNSVTPTGNGGTIAKSTTYAYESMLIPTTATWKRYELHVRTAASLSGVAVVRLSFRTYKTGQTVGGVTLSADGTALICMPKLERGAAATAYMPHETEMQGEDGYSIALTPSTIIIEQSTTKDQDGNYPLDLDAAPTAMLRVMKGGVLCNANVRTSATNCSFERTEESTGVFTFRIDGVNKQTNGEYYREGRLNIRVTPEGAESPTDMYLPFYCNLLGTFKTTIEGDVEESVASKITSTIQDGSVTTLEEVGTYIRSASRNVSQLTQRVNTHNVRMSKIEQDVSNIGLAVYESAEETIWNYFGDDIYGPGDTYHPVEADVENGDFNPFSVRGVLVVDLAFEGADSSSNVESGEVKVRVRVDNQQVSYETAFAYSDLATDERTGSDFTRAYRKEIVLDGIAESVDVEVHNGLNVELNVSSVYAGYTRISADGIREDLVRTGVDIENRKITAQADNFEIWNNAKTKKTFSIDQDGNLMSAGDAYIGGTIRAQNFFHNVCIFNGDATPSAYSYQRCYVPQNYSVAWDNETAEGAENAPYRGKEGQYVVAAENAECLVPCTYDADIILSTTYTSGKTVHIPKASDFVGKCIEIYNLSANTENYIYIRQSPDYTSDGNTLAYGTPFVYGWNNGGWNNNSDSVQLMGLHKVVLYSYRASYGAGAVWLRLGTFTITNN